MSGGLFSLDDFTPRVQVPPELSDFAFVYTATAGSGGGTVRFAMTVEDAMAWCSSDLSRGSKYGTEWAYFWTRVTTFVGVFGTEIAIDRAFDDGEWDDRIASLGLTMIRLSEFRDFFGQYGLTFITLGSREAAA